MANQNPDKSTVHMAEIVLPSHTNALGTIFGGVVMSWIDIAAAIAAQRYARSPAVTVSLDQLKFFCPIKVGYTVRLEGRVNWAGRTSMEIEVTVFAENSILGTTERATHAFLTFVAVDSHGKPKAVPPFKPENADERTRYETASKRRENRLKFFQQ